MNERIAGKILCTMKSGYAFVLSKDNEKYVFHVKEADFNVKQGRTVTFIPGEIKDEPSGKKGKFPYAYDVKKGIASL